MRVLGEFKVFNYVVALPHSRAHAQRKLKQTDALEIVTQFFIHLEKRVFMLGYDISMLFSVIRGDK